MACASPIGWWAMRISWNRCATAPSVLSHYDFGWSRFGCRYGFGCHYDGNHCDFGWWHFGCRCGFGCDSVNDFGNQTYSEIASETDSIPNVWMLGSPNGIENDFLSQIYCASGIDSSPNDWRPDFVTGNVNEISTLNAID